MFTTHSLYLYVTDLYPSHSGVSYRIQDAITIPRIAQAGPCQQSSEQVTVADCNIKRVPEN